MPRGIASAMTQPHSLLMYNPTTLIIRGHHGFVCQDAINACMLAQRGIDGPRNGVLSSQAGYAGFIHWDTDISVVTEDLGKKWYIKNLQRKRYPIAASALTSVDGMILQMEEHSFTGHDIEHINLVLQTKLAGRVNNPAAREAQWNPQTVHDCQFSVPYGVATAAYDGDVFLTSFTEAARTREDVRDLISRITVTSDNRLPPLGARLVTRLGSGQQFTSEYRYPRGHADYPLEDQDLIEKFIKCAPYSAFPVSDAVARSVCDRILALETIPDTVREIVMPLTGSEIDH